MTDSQAVNEISAHVGGDQRTTWYAGIASDPEDCLFSRHRVDRINGGWAWRKALNSAHARSAEVILHNAGFDGGAGGGDNTTIFVYAYKKTPTTVE